MLLNCSVWQSLFLLFEEDLGAGWPLFWSMSWPFIPGFRFFNPWISLNVAEGLNWSTVLVFPYALRKLSSNPRRFDSPPLFRLARASWFIRASAAWKSGFDWAASCYSLDPLVLESSFWGFLASLSELSCWPSVCPDPSMFWWCFISGVSAFFIFC